jgi:predicted RND superfamily exporter protein
LLSFLIAVASLLGIARLEGRHDPLTWLPENDEARVSLEAVDRTVAGTATVELMISAPRGQTLLHHDVMRRLEALETHVLAYRRAGREDERVVTNVNSVLNVLRQGLRAGALEPDAYGLPTSEQGLIDVFTHIEAAGVPSLRQLITPDAQHAVMSLRVHWLEASAYASLQEHITAGVREHIGTAAHVELTGSAYANSEVANALIDTLSKSFLTALVIIALLMVVMLADFKLGIVAMLPNVLPIMLVGGLVGAIGMPLDINTVLVASIAIGIAVDDTIHFFYRFHAHEPQLGSEGAIAASFLATARAVIATSTVLALGFAAFAFAEMVSIRRFGLLITACIAVAMLAELILTPALLRAVYGRSRDAEKAEPKPGAG